MGIGLGNRIYYFERFTQRVTYPFHLLSTSSPRRVLFAINFLLTICCLCLAGFAIFLCDLFYDPGFVSGWIIWMGLAIVSLGLAIVSIIGMRGAHMVSLNLLLTFFWGISIFVAPLLLSLYSCFNFYFYMRIWFKHQWSTKRFSDVREIFCRPQSTAGNKCVAPLSANLILPDDDYTVNQSNYTTNWCIQNYNATDCGEIRDEAINRAVDWGGKVIAVQSAVGLLGIFIIAGSIYTSYQILTSPVITESMMDVINYLLIFPIAGCIALTIYFWWIQDLLEGLTTTSLPILFLVLGLMQVVALPLGIISGRNKSRAMLIVYITLMILIVLGFAAIGGLSWILSGELQHTYRPSNETVAEIACRKSLPGCSGCEQDTPACPEWPRHDVMTLIALDFRLSGMVALFSILYIIGGLIVAFLTDNSLKNYKTDFV
eukprot:gene3295-3615_t